MRALATVALLAALGVSANVADAQLTMTGVGGGFGAAAGGGFTATYQTTQTCNASFGTTCTISGISIGAASSSRIVTAIFSTDYAGSSPGLGTPTICGVSGTLAKNDGGSVVKTAAYYANVTSGTTCSVVINGNGLNGVVLSVWTISGQSGGGSAAPVGADTIYSTNGNGAGDPSTISVTVPSGGVVFAFSSADGNASFTGCTVTGATYGGAGGPVGSNNEEGCAATATATGSVGFSGNVNTFGFGSPQIAVAWGP